MTIEASTCTDDGHISSGKDQKRRQQNDNNDNNDNNNKTTTTTQQQRTTKQNSGTVPQQQHADHDVNGDDYNNYKNYNDNTTFIYEHLRHTELLRPVHPFAGNGTASQPLPALRNLVRRAAAVYSVRESFIV